MQQKLEIRLMAENEQVEQLAEKIVDLVEADGFEVIEWSKPKPNFKAEPEQSRIYLTLLKEVAA